MAITVGLGVPVPQLAFFKLSDIFEVAKVWFYRWNTPNCPCNDYTRKTFVLGTHVYWEKGKPTSNIGCILQTFASQVIGLATGYGQFTREVMFHRLLWFSFSFELVPCIMFKTEAQFPRLMSVIVCPFLVASVASLIIEGHIQGNISQHPLQTSTRSFFQQQEQSWWIEQTRNSKKWFQQ